LDEIKNPLWVRVTDVILGILAIGASVFVLVYPVLSLDLLILLIAMGLMLLGIARILRGIFSRVLYGIKRAFSIAYGFIVLVVTLIILLNPAFTTLLSFWVLIAALIAHGFVRIFFGVFSKTYPRRLKYILVIVGVLTLILALMAFLLPYTIGYLVIYLLAVGLLAAGIGRIALGLYGFK
jgi:uncharacterized membrane protein HdeD (DUF308 family)